MINIIQPLVNLTNANLQATSRFIQAPEIAELTKANLEKYTKVARESFTQIAQSDALDSWMQQTMQNFSRFSSECMQSSFGLISQAPNLFAHQMQDFSQQVEQGINATVRATGRTADYIDEASEAGSQDDSHQARSKARQQRQTG